MTNPLILNTTLCLMQNNSQTSAYLCTVQKFHHKILYRNTNTQSPQLFTTNLSRRMRSTITHIRCIYASMFLRCLSHARTYHFVLLFAYSSNAIRPSVLSVLSESIGERQTKRKHVCCITNTNRFDKQNDILSATQHMRQPYKFISDSHTQTGTHASMLAESLL